MVEIFSIFLLKLKILKAKSTHQWDDFIFLEQIAYSDQKRQ